VLANHPAVLSDPEPSVLTDGLGRATVDLRVYFWLNGHEHSWLKVRSSVIRLVKRAFQQHGISMPDEAREVIFPRGLPVTLAEGVGGGARGAAAQEPSGTETRTIETDQVSTKAEAGLSSEAAVIENQAREVRPLPTGGNLLRPTSAPSRST
jgi:hypothetical protein